MTYAPAKLKEARAFLLAHLDMHPTSHNYPGDLDPAEVGIVGDTGHAATGTSYHLGKDQLRSTSYSIVESPRDRRGLTDAASGLDVGWFSVTVDGRVHNLRTFSIWLVDECRAGTPDTLDIREVIYSPDGRNVLRWDRLKARTTGDNSHLYHTHVSYFRDSEGRDKAGLFRRYLSEIGLLEADMTKTDLIDWLADPQVREALCRAVFNTDGVIAAPAGSTNGDGSPNTHWTPGSYLTAVYAATVTMRAQLRDAADRGEASPESIAAAIAAAIPADLAGKVVAELSARLAA
jgi:hypothetical protein